MRDMLAALFERDSRKQFVPQDVWLLSPHTNYDWPSSLDELSTLQPFLPDLYFTVPFEARVSLFRHMQRTSFFRGSTARLKINRDTLVEDGFLRLNKYVGGEIIRRFDVNFINTTGLSEMGIDAGGVSKEFIVEFARGAFHPQYGLFVTTQSRHIYPRPNSHIAVEDHLEKFAVLGIVLAMAIKMNILMDIPFANFFLSKLLGKQNYVNDLQYYDAQLYKNLMVLRDYEGDVETDFDLTFSVTVNDFDNPVLVDLIPNGSSIPVTKENRVSYITLVAQYYLNTRFEAQSHAFCTEFFRHIQPESIRLFNERELQFIISGHDAGIDILDLRANTKYQGWSDTDKAIEEFWVIVDSFDIEDQRLLLSFVTSCPKPPLLGFKELDPQFTIVKVPDPERLPTASTCFNQLKLPDYGNIAITRSQLLKAIRSKAGFEYS